MELAFQIFVILTLLWNTALLMSLGGAAIYIYRKQPLIKLDNLFQLVSTLKKDIRDLPNKLPSQQNPVATTIEDLDKQELNFIIKELMDQGFSANDAYNRANEIMLEKVGKYMEGGMNPYDGF